MCWPYQPTEWFVISPFQLVHGMRSVATKDLPLEKKVDTKYMQVNLLRNIVRVKKRGDDIPTH